jgi:hypothetical protein
MENENSEQAPLITFELWTPLSKEQYEIMLELGMNDIIFYKSLDKLFEMEGIDSDYTSEKIPLYDELYAN